jgi:gluconate 2-dehydrogenase gamma chain
MDPKNSSVSSAWRDGLSRRDAVKLATLGALGVAVGASGVATLGRFVGEAAPRWRFLTEEEAELVNAIAEVLIPRDDAPGGADANVVGYIDTQLAGFFADQQSSYRRGLRAFDETCRRDYGDSFARLSPEKKITALTALEKGAVTKTPWGDQSPSAFFTLLLNHTMQGYYGSPRHGGNKDFASYRAMGLELPQVVGRNVYSQNKLNHG